MRRAPGVSILPSTAASANQLARAMEKILAACTGKPAFSKTKCCYPLCAKLCLRLLKMASLMAFWARCPCRRSRPCPRTCLRCRAWQSAWSSPRRRHTKSASHGRQQCSSKACSATSEPLLLLRVGLRGPATRTLGAADRGPGGSRRRHAEGPGVSVTKVNDASPPPMRGRGHNTKVLRPLHAGRPGAPPLTNYS